MLGSLWGPYLGLVNGSGHLVGESWNKVMRPSKAGQGWGRWRWRRRPDHTLCSALLQGRPLGGLEETQALGSGVSSSLLAGTLLKQHRRLWDTSDMTPLSSGFFWESGR